MVFLLGALCYTICTMKAPPQALALEGPEEEPSWHVPFHGIYRSLLSRPWKGLEMVFLFGALCYTICIMKAPPQALPGPGEEPTPMHHIGVAWHLALPPGRFQHLLGRASW